MKAQTAIAAAVLVSASLLTANAQAAIIATIDAGQVQGNMNIIINNTSNTTFDSMSISAFGNNYTLSGLAAHGSYNIPIVQADYDQDVGFSISVTIGSHTYWSPGITEETNLTGGYVDYGGTLNDVDFTPVEVGNIQASLGAAPEPASWALMILGLGGVGAALRRNPRRAPFAA